MYYLSSVLIGSENIRGFRLKKIFYDLYSTRSSTYDDIQIFAYNEILGQAFKNLNSSKLSLSSLLILYI